MAIRGTAGLAIMSWQVIHLRLLHACASLEELLASLQAFEELLCGLPSLTLGSWCTRYASDFGLSSLVNILVDFVEYVLKKHTLMQKEHGLLRSHFFLRCWQSTQAKILLDSVGLCGCSVGRAAMVVV